MQITHLIIHQGSVWRNEGGRRENKERRTIGDLEEERKRSGKQTRRKKRKKEEEKRKEERERERERENQILFFFPLDPCALLSL